MSLVLYKLILHGSQSCVHAQGEWRGRPLLCPVDQGPFRRLRRLQERPPRRQERRRRGQVQGLSNRLALGCVIMNPVSCRDCQVHAKAAIFWILPDQRFTGKLTS